MHLLLALLALAVLAYVVGETIITYRKTPGTGWFTAFRESLTLLWAQILIASGAIIGFAAQAADYFNDPAVADAIRALVKPEYVPVAIAIIGILIRLGRSYRQSKA